MFPLERTDSYAEYASQFNAAAEIIAYLLHSTQPWKEAAKFLDMRYREDLNMHLVYS